MGRKVADFPMNELRDYNPELINKPDNFDQFWYREKTRLENVMPHFSVDWRDYPVPTAEVADIVLESFDTTPLKGLFIKPKELTECPVIVSFHGYTGSRGLAADYLKWLNLGVAVISFDVRGQGSSPDYARYANGSRIPGWMLKGIDAHSDYYYTNVYRDIMLQLNWIRSKNFPVKATKVGAMGASQGGALALVAAGLDGHMDFVVSDWPFIAHFERALEVALTGPYMEIINYFKWNDPLYKKENEVMRTLGYIDSVHFCSAITCSVLMAVGLEDSTTPPSTVFAAYNHISSSDKHIEVYPQFTHEGNPFHEEKKIEFVATQLQV
ncbi:acetylxylan esterase [Virgibacillus kekensis]|uniref:Acetylxylan esterase n=1 Tax=Virgibacillus kekensis TaxID=202261 RepID=A0ABV9DIQ4_9BACI